MNAHLSHSPHQAEARRAGSTWNARLQLRNTGWYSVSSANRSATQSSEYGRSAEK